MNLSALFIRRPVATSLLMLALLLSGALAYRFLPVASLPQVDYPTIQVSTLYPGASPNVMTASVTAPLERQFGQMPGLALMTSVSSGGASIITLRFSLKLPIDIAEQQVQAAVNASANFLPADLPMPPSYSKVNPADAPIMTLAVSAEDMPLTQIHDLVENRCRWSTAGCAGASQSAGIGGRWLVIRGCAQCHQPQQREHGQRQSGRRCTRIELRCE